MRFLDLDHRFPSVFLMPNYEICIYILLNYK